LCLRAVGTLNEIHAEMAYDRDDHESFAV